MEQIQGLSLRAWAVLGVCLGIGIPWGIWWMLQPPALTPIEQTYQALEMLEEGRTRSAYLAAIKLLQDRVSDPNIGGTLEYIAGTAYFRKAERVREERGPEALGIVQPNYELASRYLEKAGLKTFAPELKPQWATMLGLSYFQLERFYEARELLDQAWESAPENRAEIVWKLGTCYVDANVLKASLYNATDKQQAQAARLRMLQRIQEVTSDEEAAINTLGRLEYFRLKLLEAEFQLLTGQLAEFEETLLRIDLEELEDTIPDEPKIQLRDGVLVLQARYQLREGHPERAREQLQGLVGGKSGLEQSGTLQAHYFMGLAYAQEERFDRAAEHLNKPASISDSELCFPANIHAGELARRRGLHEEALTYYVRGLSLVKSTDRFTNRWMDMDQARQMIRDAWDEWGSSTRYEHFRYATELSERVVPLFSQVEANQMLAGATRKRAEFVQAETDALRPHVDQEQTLKTFEHWKRAGQAYARLAHSMQTSELFGRYLWDSAQLYRRGNDFENALKMVNRYIQSDPRSGLPAAYILKARLLMDLDPYSEEDSIQQAIHLLEKLQRDFPKDQAIYEAQVLLGEAYLEAGAPDQAMEVWRELLLKSPLTPAATEWQSALFALGRLLFLTSDSRPQILSQAAQPDRTPEQRSQHFEYVDEAIHWLNEFVRRNPEHPRALEARWLLAKGLRFRIQKPAERVGQAETENTRSELLKEIHQMAQRSMQQFKLLENELSLLEQQNLLDNLASQFLRDAYFEPAHIQYDLGRFDETGDAYRKAIELYSHAAFHFTGDPIVLVAYYRIAECYRELQAEDEARRQLEQARVILSQLKEPFSTRSTNFNRAAWETILEQTIRMYDLALDAQPAQPAPD